MNRDKTERRARKGGARERTHRKRRQFVPARELAEALADAPKIDYKELRADIDAYVDQDPTPRYWVE